MQDLTKYILEHINGLKVEEISTFKPNMIKSSKLVDVLKELNSYDTISFEEYISGQTNQLKYMYSDNDVFTFEKTDDINGTKLKTFIKDLRNCKNGIAQFALPMLDGDLIVNIHAKNKLTIIFSKEQIN